VPVAQQVQHPVALFASDNNGVVIKLPSVPAAGLSTAAGSLVFGIGTQDNNALGAATIFTASTATGVFTTVYKGTSYRQSFIDSGSNAIFFHDAAIPLCNNPAFYCPPSPLTLSAINQGLNGASGTVTFNVASAEQTFAQNPTNTVLPGLAGPGLNPSTFDWGLPFFLGRNVFTAIQGKSTPGGTGPYFAY
jgi:hypothetical protein